MRPEGSDGTMQNELAKNIRKYRLALGMTQERLAEAMNVTVGAVYKWEAGRSAPDIRLVMELADLFELSVDALLGYQTRPSDRAHMVERLAKHAKSPHPAGGLDEARKALQKYPNDFQVVHACARLYLTLGFLKHDEGAMRASLRLHERACLLIGQNTDPDISALSLRIAMANLHLTLEEFDQALILLTQENPNHINDALIAQVLCSSGRKDEALAYLSRAIVDSLVTQSQIVNTYVNLDDAQGGLCMLDWILSTIRILRKPGLRSPLDRQEAVYEAARGQLLLGLGRREEALSCLRKARQVAQWFDQAPCYQVNAIRFVQQNETAAFRDNLGETAFEALCHYVAQQNSAPFSKLWEDAGHEQQP